MAKDDATRRHFLRATAATALLPTALVACRDGVDIGGTDSPRLDTGDTGGSAAQIPQIAFDAELIEQDDARFPLAVQAGAMRQTTALLLTWTPQGGAVLVRVWQPVDEGVVDLFFERELTPEEGGLLRVALDGLRPGEWFEYGFFPVDAEGEPVSRSLLGRFRTALADDVLEPLTLAITACNGSGNAPWPALQATAELDYDVLCHLGDMAYNDGAESVAQYRESWRGFLVGDGFRAAYAKSGLYATWDDHEFDNDWNPETMAPDQIDAAKQTFFEHVAAERKADGTLWNSYRWGLTAEIFVLDCRSERKPSTRTGPDAEYISPAQFDWLVQGLANSPCQFKIIMNSVPITNMPLVWDAASYDRWEGFRAQRDALLAAIDEGDIDNIWLLSGDFHVCFISRLEPSGDARSDKLHEIAVTGGNTNILGDSLGIGDQFSYNTSRARACTLRFDPETDAVTVTFVDPEDGSVAHSEQLSYSNR